MVTLAGCPRLVVRTSNAAVGDVVIPGLQPTASVNTLKHRVAELHPAKPLAEEQRIVYAGRLLQDDEVLTVALRARNTDTDDKTAEPDDAVVIHLVLSAAALHRMQSALATATLAASASAAAAAPVPADSPSTPSVDGLRRRRPTALPSAAPLSSAAAGPASPASPAAAALLQQYYAAAYWRSMAAARSPPSPAAAQMQMQMQMQLAAVASAAAAANAHSLTAPGPGGAGGHAAAVGAGAASPQAAVAAYRAWYASVAGAVGAAAGTGLVPPYPGHHHAAPPGPAPTPPPSAGVAGAQGAGAQGGPQGGAQAGPEPAAAAAAAGGLPGNADAGPQGNGGRFAQAGLGAVPMVDPEDDARHERPQNPLALVYLVGKLVLLVAVFGQGASQERLACLVAVALGIFLLQLGFFAAVGDFFGRRRNPAPRAQAAAPAAPGGEGEGDTPAADSPPEEEEPEELRSPLGEMSAVLWAFVSSLWPQRGEIQV